MVFQEFSYYLIAGKPLIFYLGITTLSLVAASAILGTLVLKGKIKFAYHKIIAIIAICFAVFHGSLGMLAYI